MLKKKIWDRVVICIQKTNTNETLDMQIGLQFKDISCRCQ